MLTLKLFELQHSHEIKASANATKVERIEQMTYGEIKAYLLAYKSLYKQVVSDYETVVNELSVANRILRENQLEDTWREKLREQEEHEDEKLSKC